MTSDGRYMYQPSINPNYQYQPYPPPPHPSSYENPQLAQPPMRPMRSGSTSQQSQSPHLSSHTTHYQQHQQSSYPPPNYGQGQYMAQHPPPQPPPPQAPQPQWSNEGWAQYNQSYAPPPPPPPAVEPPFNSGPGRPESVPNPPHESRGYPPPPPPPSSESRRVEERHHHHLSHQQQQPPHHHPQQQQPSPPNPIPLSQPRPRRRERESPPAPTAAVPGTPTGLDFLKLLESYRTILDGADALTNGMMTGSASRPPPIAETLEYMLQSATYGAQMLESANVQQATPASEPHPSPKQEKPEEEKEPVNGTSAAAKRQQKPDDAVQEGQTCLGCNATSTPEWRRGPMGPRTLCNACGLVYAKLIKKRVREKYGIPKKPNGQSMGGPQPGDDSGEGDSEDDDEYDSQGRRSDPMDGGRD